MQLNEEEASGQINGVEHKSNAVVLFIRVQGDKHTKPRRLLDARDQNDAIDSNNIFLPRIEKLMELVAAQKNQRKMDLADGYHNIRIV